VTCPLCGKPISVVEAGFVCTAFKNGCRFNLGTVFGKKITEPQLRKLIKDGSTAVIKGFKNKNGEKFDAKLKIENGRLAFEYVGSKPE
jgi:DNA topoisomerase-3